MHKGAFSQFPFRWIFYTLAVINPLAKRTSVYCSGLTIGQSDISTMTMRFKNLHKISP